MSSKSCGLCCRRPRRRLQKWKGFCGNRVRTLNASKCTLMDRETTVSVGMFALAAATGNNVAWY